MNTDPALNRKASDEENQQQEETETLGKTTIAPEVLLTIIQLNTLEVPGVSRMSSVPSGVNRLLNRKYGEGIRLQINEDRVSADLFIILESDVNIREVSRRIQKRVARAIMETVGMEVGRINIHVEDIDFPKLTERSLTTEA